MINTRRAQDAQEHTDPTKCAICKQRITQHGESHGRRECSVIGLPGLQHVHTRCFNEALEKGQDDE